ncbi:MAG: gluconate:H+ symporter [Verrucomicrobiales bacterium]
MRYELLLYALFSVLLLVLLIARWKVHAFVALIIASLFIGILAGMPLLDIANGFQEGVGGVLKSIAVVIGLGTILGKLLAESGGAEVIANAILKQFGRNYLPWAMLAISLIVGLPVFFGVGVVLLAPILYSLVVKNGVSLISIGLPMLAGLSVAHGLVPPHPGPMAAIELLQANTGKTIVYSLLVGIPTAIIAGPIFTRFISRKIHLEPGPLGLQLSRNESKQNLPGFGITVLTICLPILLMLLSSVADLALDKKAGLRAFLLFLGHPVAALLAGVLFALYTFGFRRGFNKDQLGKFTEECLGPIAPIMLVIGAGGGFNKILMLSGVAQVVSDLGAQFQLSPLVLGYVVACLIRVATGSATVAITTAAGIISQMVLADPTANRELIVIAMGAGSLILSHLNDGGFWFVKEYLNMSVTQTLKTWSVMETIVSVVAFGFLLILDRLL